MNIGLDISYIGTNYSGWQVQPNKTTIQGELEKALKKVFCKDISTTASGRTDAGVSAYCQVVNFHADTNIPVDRLVYVINEHLPKDIRVLRTYKVAEDFNARYSAKKKTYEYYFYFGDVENAILSEHSLFVRGSLDIDTMKKACKKLQGEWDFSSFCASDTEVENKVRTIYDIDIVECDRGYKLVVTGNGFLYNMVRIIMGTMIDVGFGKYSIEDISRILEAKDRCKAGHTAPPTGLTLLKVQY